MIIDIIEIYCYWIWYIYKVMANSWCVMLNMVGMKWKKKIIWNKCNKVNQVSNILLGIGKIGWKYIEKKEVYEWIECV